MKILVTGANGFIGSAITNNFSSKYDITSTSKRESSKKNFIKINLENEYTNQLKKNKFDIIIHCASNLASQENISSLDLFNKNIKITQNMISIVKQTKPRLLINLSTIAVYPNKTGEYSEQSIIKPSENAEGIYGLSKFCSEEIFNFSFKKTNTKVLNLRLGQTIGKGMRNDRVYSMMISELNKKNIINVYGNGKRSSGFLNIEYFLEKLEKIIENKKIQGTYNFVEENMSYLDLANEIIKKYGDSNSSINILSEGVDSKVKIDSNKIKRYIDE